MIPPDDGEWWMRGDHVTILLPVAFAAGAFAGALMSWLDLHAMLWSPVIFLMSGGFWLALRAGDKRQP